MQKQKHVKKNVQTDFVEVFDKTVKSKRGGWRGGGRPKNPEETDIIRLPVSLIQIIKDLKKKGGFDLIKSRLLKNEDDDFFTEEQELEFERTQAREIAKLYEESRK